MTHRVPRIALALVLVAATLAVDPAGWVAPVQAENPVTADVYAGDAHAAASGASGLLDFVLRTINDDSPMAHRTWEANPGAGLTVYFRTVTSGLVPPGLPDGAQAADYCRLRVYADNGATLVRNLHDTTTCPATGTAFTVYCTTDGTATGTPVSGTLRLRILARNDSPVGTEYAVDSDTEDRGALRCGMAVTALTHAGYPGAATTHAATVAGEVMGFTASHSRILGGQVAAASISTLDASDAVLQTNSLNLAQTGATTTAFTVSDAYPAAQTSLGLRLQIGTSALTGVKWTHITSASSPVTAPDAASVKRSAFVQVDARLTATHLLQLNDAGFGTPPMSKDAGDGRRLTSDLGFTATRFTNARGEGLNGLTFTQTLVDQAALTTGQTHAGLLTAAQGGQDGWGPLKAWSDALPSGTWLKAADITAPSLIDSNSHLGSATRQLFLVAPNFNLQGILAASRSDTNEGQAFLPGAGLEVQFTVLDRNAKQIRAVDAGTTPTVTFTRTASGVVQYLNSGNTWTNLGAGTAYAWPMTVQGDASWRLTFTGTQTLGWGFEDLQLTARGLVNGASVLGYSTLALSQGGGADPVTVVAAPGIANPGETVLLSIHESFLDGSARTGNAAGTNVYIYNPSQALLVNGANPAEIQFGAYRYAYPLGGSPAVGAYNVVVKTTDSLTGAVNAATTAFYVEADLYTLIQSFRAEVQTRLDALQSDTDALQVDSAALLARWGTLSAADLDAGLDSLDVRIGNTGDASTAATLFGRLVQLAELTQTNDASLDAQMATLASSVTTLQQTVDAARQELGGQGMSQTLYALLQSVDAQLDAVGLDITKILTEGQPQLSAPDGLVIPPSGSRTYQLDFVLQSLAGLRDPDSNQVDITVTKSDNTAGVSGLTLTGSPAGRMTRLSTGVYRLQFTVASTATINEQVRWTATWLESGVPQRAVAVSTLNDLDTQLGRMETALASLQADADALQLDTANLMAKWGTWSGPSLAAEVDELEERLGQATDTGAIASLFGKLQAFRDLHTTDDANLDAQLASLQAVVNGLSSTLAAFRAEVGAEGQTPTAYNLLQALQAALANLAGDVTALRSTAMAEFHAPSVLQTPATGTKTYTLVFLLGNVGGLKDPDSNQVDVVATNRAGAAPPGISLAGTPAGRMPRASQGHYTLTVTVGTSAATEDQVTFTATYLEGGATRKTAAVSNLMDLDTQLNRLEASLTAVQADVDLLQADTATLKGKWGTWTAAALAAEVDALEENLGAPSDAASASTLFGRLQSFRDLHTTDDASLDAQLAALQSTAADLTATLASFRAEVGAQGQSQTAYTLLLALQTGLGGLSSDVATLRSFGVPDLTGPGWLAIPATGSRTYQLHFTLQSAIGMKDPDGTQLDFTATDPAGAAVPGLTLAGTPSGRATRSGTGDYSALLTVSTLASPTQVRLTAIWSEAGVVRRISISTLVDDVDAQLGRLEVATSALQGDVDQLQADTSALLTKWGTWTAAALAAEVNTLEESVGLATDAATAATLFGRIKQLNDQAAANDASLDSQLATLQTTATAINTLLGQVRAELGAAGQSQTAYAFLQSIHGLLTTVSGDVASLKASIRATLAVPTHWEIPATGIRTYVLDLGFSSLAGARDPDGNVVDVTVVNQAHAAPAGVTLGGIPAGRFTRSTTGQYALAVTVDAAASPNDQLRWTVTYTEGGIQQRIKATTTLVDGLQRLAGLQTAVGALQADADALQDDTGQLLAKWGTWTASALAGEVEGLAESIGTASDAPSAATLFGRLSGLANQQATDDASLDGQLATLQATATNLASVLASLRADVGAQGQSQTVYQSVQAVHTLLGTVSTDVATIKTTGLVGLAAPEVLEIPATGSRSYVIEFSLQAVTGPKDPDSSIVNLAVLNQAGAAASGVTLGGSPAGRFTRTSAGFYTVTVTVASTAPANDELRWTASYTEATVAKRVKAISLLVDHDTQLNRMETSLGALQADVDLLQLDTAALLAKWGTWTLPALALEVDGIEETVGTPTDGASAATVFGRIQAFRDLHVADDANLDAQLTALHSLTVTVHTLLDEVHSELGAHGQSQTVHALMTTIHTLLGVASNDVLALKTMGVPRLTVPSLLQIPTAGTRSYVAEFNLQAVTGLKDPDGQIADLAVVNPAGAAPGGITLAGTPAGRLTRSTTGLYTLSFTVAATSAPNEQLRWTLTYLEAGITRKVTATATLEDLDVQLGRIESALAAAQSDLDALQLDAANLIAKWGTWTGPSLAAEVDSLEERVGTSTDLATAATLFGRIRQVKEETEGRDANVLTQVQALQAATAATSSLLSELHSELGAHGKTRTAYVLLEAIESALSDLALDLAAARVALLDDSASRWGYWTTTFSHFWADYNQTEQAQLLQLLDAMAVLHDENEAAFEETLNTIQTAWSNLTAGLGRLEARSQAFEARLNTSLAAQYAAHLTFRSEVLPALAQERSLVLGLWTSLNQSLAQSNASQALQLDSILAAVLNESTRLHTALEAEGRHVRDEVLAGRNVTLARLDLHDEAVALRFQATHAALHDNFTQLHLLLGDSRGEVSAFWLAHNQTWQAWTTLYTQNQSEEAGQLRAFVRAEHNLTRSNDSFNHEAYFQKYGLVVQEYSGYIVGGLGEEILRNRDLLNETRQHSLWDNAWNSILLDLVTWSIYGLVFVLLSLVALNSRVRRVLRSLSPFTGLFEAWRRRAIDRRARKLAARSRRARHQDREATPTRGEADPAQAPRRVPRGFRP